MASFGLIERDYWTKSGLLGKVVKGATTYTKTTGSDQAPALPKADKWLLARTKKDMATGSSGSSVEEEIGRHEKDSKPVAVTSSAALIGSVSREVVQEEATQGDIPSCWKVFFPI
jgi:hypothetical protein